MNVLDFINTELLLRRIKESGLNYNELAASVGVSRNTIYNVSFGRTSPSYYVTRRLTDALNLSNDDIMAIFFMNRKLKNG